MQDLLSGRVLNLLPPVSAGILLLATLWFHLQPSSTLALTESSAPVGIAQAPTAVASADLWEIPGWQLFAASAGSGPAEVSAHAPPPTESLEDLPPTSIDLKVSGIAFSLDARRAYAIVGPPNGQQRQYRVGDVLAEGVAVHAIRPLEVVISNQGKLESLALPLDSRSGGAAPAERYSGPNLPQFPGIPPGMPEIPVQQPGPMPMAPTQ